MGCPDEVILDLEVLVDELATVSVIGVDATDQCGCHDNGVWFLPRDKFPGFNLIHQIELCSSAADDVGVALGL